jgi:hypothetical protein
MVTDSDAPALPLKDKEIVYITNLAQSENIKNDTNDINGEIYTNTKEAKQALDERANYIKTIDSDYLITGNDCDELLD